MKRNTTHHWGFRAAGLMVLALVIAFATSCESKTVYTKAQDGTQFIEIYKDGYGMRCTRADVDGVDCVICFGGDGRSGLSCDWQTAEQR